MKMKRGKIRVWAKRELNYEPIPIFVDNRINRAIDAEFRRMLRRRTFVPAAERKTPLPDGE